MRSQKLLSVFLLLLFFVPGVLFALSGGWQTLTLPSAASIWDGTAAQWTENILAESFAGKDFLCSAAAALQTALGRNQQNGCFYGEDGILQNLPDADEAITANNLQALQAYSPPNLLALLFSAVAYRRGDCAAKNPQLGAGIPVQSKAVYPALLHAPLSSFRTIDAYNGLFSHRSEYLFYRTDSRLTALGCYYLYVSAGEKLGYTARSMDYFSISHPMHDYRGNLTQQVPYAQVEPDVISLFHYQKHNRDIRLVQDPLGNASAAPLYDTSLLKSSDPLQVYLGPNRGVTDLLVSETPYDGCLLVLTDGSCNALFPLIAIHYQQIRVVDLRSVTADQLAQINPDSFDQVLFAFSVETFGYDSLVGDVLGEG